MSQNPANKSRPAVRSVGEYDVHKRLVDMSATELWASWFFIGWRRGVLVTEVNQRQPG